MTTPPADAWNASRYAQHSSLQEAMAAQVLALLDLRGDERVLDVGCGDGRITARIAARVPRGTVLGTDRSPDMIAHAAATWGAGAPQGAANLRFEVADAAALPYTHAFERVVSFNALHWLHDLRPALRGIAAALVPGGRAQLRFVTRGVAASLEEVAEAQRRQPRWAPHFGSDFADPYLRLDADACAALAAAAGLQVQRVHSALEGWDFVTDDAFLGFCSAGFGAWTNHLPAAERRPFVEDVVRAYRRARGAGAADANVFRFVQTDFVFTLPPA